MEVCDYSQHFTRNVKQELLISYPKNSHYQDAYIKLSESGVLQEKKNAFFLELEGFICRLYSVPQYKNVNHTSRYTGIKISRVNFESH